MFQQSQSSLSILQNTINDLYLTFTRYIGKVQRWWLTIQDLEWSSIYWAMKGSVVPIFRHWEPMSPFVRGIRTQTSEVIFQTSIQYLRLTVGLWMVRSRKKVVHPCQSKELLPECTDKNLISIRDDCLGKPVKLIDIVHKCLSNVSNSERVW